MADGSVRFVLRGGPADGRIVRLFPMNDGWEELMLEGERYVAPYDQDDKKPFMTAGSSL